MFFAEMDFLLNLQIDCIHLRFATLSQDLTRYYVKHPVSVSEAGEIKLAMYQVLVLYLKDIIEIRTICSSNSFLSHTSHNSDMSNDY
jgi:hypothetical protein